MPEATRKCVGIDYFKSWRNDTVMGRPSKYRNHPVFILRESLTPGDPMTQVELSELLDVPLLSLQALESGRRGKRGVPRTILQKIKSYTGCLWDDVTKSWLFDMRLLPGREFQPGRQFVPVTPELFSEYRKLVVSPIRPDQRVLDLILFKAWLEEIGDRMPASEWLHFASRYSDFIEQLCRDFRLGDPVAFFSTVSEKNEPILLAAYEHANKSKQLAEKLRDQAADLSGVLATLGPDSKDGPRIIEARKLALDLVGKVPPAKSRKRPKRKP